MWEPMWESIYFYKMLFLESEQYLLWYDNKPGKTN